MKTNLTWDYLNSLTNKLDSLPKLVDKAGKELPKDKMWLVADPVNAKKYKKLAAGRHGIEIRDAFIEGKKVTVAGL